MKNVCLTSFVFAFFLTSSPSWASYDELVFGSSQDYFKLQSSGTGYQFDGKSVELGAFANFLPLFSKDLTDDCPQLPSKPTLTVKAKKGSSTLTRNFYMAEKIMSDGKQCLSVEGDGIYYLPLHRSWFKGARSSSLELGKNIEIVFPDGATFKAQKIQDEWRPESDGHLAQDWYMNWIFFDRFAKSLAQHTVDFRLHPAIGKGRPQFQIKQGSRTFKFYQVGHNLWALHSPRHEWLVASHSWGFWQDMKKSMFMDRHSDNLKVLADPQAELSARRKALAEAAGTLSRASKYLIHRQLLDPGENTQLRLEMIQSLKRRPSLDNIGALIEALPEASEPELQEAITHALRVRRPDGPLITENSDQDERTNAIHDWQTWWKGLNHSKPGA